MKLRLVCAPLAAALGVASLALAQAAPAKAAPAKAPPAAAFPAAPAAPAPSASATSSPSEQPGEPPPPPPGASRSGAAQAPAQTAQPAAMPPPPPAPPGYYYGPYPYPYYYAPPPPPPPPAPRRPPAKFYMSFAIGPGLVTGSNSSASQGTFSGADVSAHLFLGARPNSLLAIGGGFVHDDMFSLSAKSDTPNGAPNLSHTSMAINMLCVFVAWTPPPVPGLYFPTYMGIGALTQTSDAMPPPRSGSNSFTSDPTVFLLGAGVGYEFDLGAHVHLGPLLRADFGNFNVNSNTGADVTVLVPALMLSASYDMGR